MGQAKDRGTKEERVQQALNRKAEMLKTKPASRSATRSLIAASLLSYVASQRVQDQRLLAQTPEQLRLQLEGAKCLKS